MRTITYFTALFLFFSCQNETKKETSEIEKSTKSTQSDSLVETVNLEDYELTESMKTDELIALFKRRKTKAMNDLKKMNQEQANSFYLNYRKENGEIISRLNALNENLLIEYYSESPSIIKNIKQLKSKLSQSGIEFRDVGEGMAELTTEPTLYYTVFKEYVSEDCKDFLFILQEEDKKMYAADAGLVITFKEVGDRVLNWEKFFKKHPKSKFKNQGLELYQFYQMDYLFGLDNTPTTERIMDGREPYIYDQNRDEFNRFVAKNPTSPTTKLVKLYIEKFSDENIREIMEKEQAKIIAKLK